MSRLKCRWDRMVMPPEEMGRMKKWFVKATLIFSLVPIVIGILLLLVYFLFWKNTEMIMLSSMLILVGFSFLALMWMTASFIGNKKYHNGAKLYLKEISLDQATNAVERFLKNKNLEYLIERPKGWSYRGYLFPPNIAFYIKKEFIIGIHFFTGPDKEFIRQIKIMYLPSIWDEALVIQKEMDHYFHDRGLAQPMTEGSQLHFN